MGMESLTNFGDSPEQSEKLKNRYVYYNKELDGHPVIFECQAEDIAQADELFATKLGKKPDKSGHIGLSIL